MSEISYPLAEHIPEPIFVFENSSPIQQNNGAPIISWVNVETELWVGRSSRTIIGKPLGDITKAFNALSQNIFNTMQNQSSVRGHDLIIEFVGGQKFICDYLIFQCPQGTALMMLPKQAGLNDNDTHLKEESVNMLGRMLAHELKNPLAGIRGAAQLLESELDRADNLELTGLIQDEVDRIGRLVEQIELFGSGNFAPYTKLNIHSILRKAKLLFQSQNEADHTQRSIELSENYDPSLPDVYGDKDGLMQVTVNLIANAVEVLQNVDDSEKAQGKIEIQTLYRTGVVKRLADGTTISLPVEVRIIDNGPGIDVNIRDRVFQPFVTSKANGHGLGLALVQKIITEHGGLVDVKTKLGRTVFSFLLPITPMQNTAEDRR